MWIFHILEYVLMFCGIVWINMFIHEMGHFLTGVLVGEKPKAFFVGGPLWFLRHKFAGVEWGTGFGLIPQGFIAGPTPRKAWKHFLLLAGGPLANIATFLLTLHSDQGFVTYLGFHALFFGLVNIIPFAVYYTAGHWTAFVCIGLGYLTLPFFMQVMPQWPDSVLGIVLAGLIFYTLVCAFFSYVNFVHGREAYEAYIKKMPTGDGQKLLRIYLKLRRVRPYLRHRQQRYA